MNPLDLLRIEPYMGGMSVIYEPGEKQMSGTLMRTALVAIGLTAAFTVAAGPASVTAAVSPALQGGLQQAMRFFGAEPQNPGRTMLAGAAVRDHRSCAPNCGSYNTSSQPSHGGGPYGGGYDGGRNHWQIPAKSGQGGVTITPTPGGRNNLF